ncbi:MAG: methanogenesis marker protein Mmp4/MtxX, partial [Promethearchaeota archaeon]
NQIKRLALLETHKGYQFFYGPVGIDECHDFDSKIQFIEAALDLMRKLNIVPKISILSGGREDDIGRIETVDKSICEALKIMDYFRERMPTLSLTHDHILIENAIKNKANLIIAPEGISGNLIYRTLVHLGGGKAHGAIYMELNKQIIDTSRVGHASEIEGALLMASALLS